MNSSHAPPLGAVCSTFKASSGLSPPSQANMGASSVLPVSRVELCPPPQEMLKVLTLNNPRM